MCWQVHRADNAAVEKQFRYPTEYGRQKPPTGPMDDNGSRVALVAPNGSKQGEYPHIAPPLHRKGHWHGIERSFQYGGAMAPAAADTILAHFKDTGLTPDDYDFIITGDLGQMGVRQLMTYWNKRAVISIRKIQGLPDSMGAKRTSLFLAGGSGAGCSAVVLYGHILNEMISVNIKKSCLSQQERYCRRFPSSKKIRFRALPMQCPLNMGWIHEKGGISMLAMFFWAFVIGELDLCSRPASFRCC